MDIVYRNIHFNKLHFIITSLEEKIMKKMFTLFISVFMLFTLNHVKSNAEEYTTSHTLKFTDFSYTTNKISSNSIIEYSKVNDLEVYTIRDSSTNLITDVYTIQPVNVEEKSVLKDTSNISTSIFTYDHKVYGDGQLVVTLRLTASVQYYSLGSFRSFEGVNYTNVSIADGISDMEITSSDSEAHSNTGKFPTTQLDYSYTVNVKATFNKSLNVSLLGAAGFSVSSDTHYYKVISTTGLFRLY